MVIVNPHLQQVELIRSSPSIQPVENHLVRIRIINIKELRGYRATEAAGVTQ
jgi:hypothetical protein